MLTGELNIGNTFKLGTDGKVHGINPATGEQLEPAFGYANSEEVNQAAELAWKAFDIYRATSPEQRGKFLETIANNIEANAEAIVQRANLETGLSEARLGGELKRTTNQLRLFAETLREGSSFGVRIDPAQPDRQPAPRSDIRQLKIPVGPVVVFGSSNFPLAFSNAGGDTASALAAGCPVIVKVHNAHPGTAELVSRAIISAVSECGLPDGVYSSLIGAGTKIGTALVTHPKVKAVGFTGSRGGGLALVAAAAGRAEPIPVYAEMSSVNPVLIFNSRISDSLAQGYVDSLTLGSGQFCTNPGSVFVPSGEKGDQFLEAVKAAVAKSVGQTMLTAGIHEAFKSGTETLSNQAGVETLGSGSEGSSQLAPAPKVLLTDFENYKNNPELAAEVFGATSIIVRYDTVEDLLQLIDNLEGQLTATVHAEQEDWEKVKAVLPALEKRVGRILFNGWPTGVEVNHAMVHGGPFPATSDGRSTSVGSLAIERFLRPVAYQDFPEELLPAPVKSSNPWNLTRRIDGKVEPQN